MSRAAELVIVVVLAVCLSAAALLGLFIYAYAWSENFLDPIYASPTRMT